MVQRHGANAFEAVESKLEKMRRDGVDEDHFRRWRWVARAVLEVTRLEPKATAEHRYEGGKPTARSKAAEIKVLTEQGLGATEIARRLGIGRASVYRARIA
jgi:DNA invertase Pin-like site-specific DNA recombinase